MKYIELFAGIGGFRKALDSLGHNCVWFNEIDKHAIKIYNNYYGEKNEPTDIRLIREREIPQHDLIVGGFPCQSFSIAGKRKGFKDTRGTLFFEIMRIAKFHRTKYLLLENVKGLINHENGDTFRTILTTFDELGYDVQWQVLNSKHFGVPQNRERVFISAVLRGSGGRQILPIRERNQKVNEIDKSSKEIMIGITNASPFEFKIQTKNCHCLCARDYKDPKIVLQEIKQLNIINQVQVADYRNDEGLRIRNDNNVPTLMSCKTSKSDLCKMPALIIHNNYPQNLNKFNVKVYDDYNSRMRKDDILGTLTCNIGSKATRTGQKIIIDPIQLGQGKYTRAVKNRTLTNKSDIGFTIRAGNPNGVIIHNLQQRSADRPSILKNKNAGGVGHLSRTDGITYCLDTGNTQAIEIQGGLQSHQKSRNDGISPTLTSAMGSGGGQIPIINKIRRLTPKECYRLQGFCPQLHDGTFDDSFYDKAKEVVSATQIYKTAGNAVTVNVIVAIVSQYDN